MVRVMTWSSNHSTACARLADSSRRIPVAETGILPLQPFFIKCEIGSTLRNVVQNRSPPEDIRFFQSVRSIKGFPVGSIPCAISLVEKSAFKIVTLGPPVKT